LTFGEGDNHQNLISGVSDVEVGDFSVFRPKFRSGLVMSRGSSVFNVFWARGIPTVLGFLSPDPDDGSNHSEAGVARGWTPVLSFQAGSRTSLPFN